MLSKRIAALALLSACLALSCGGGGTEDEAYVVNIARDLKAGDKFRIASSGVVTSSAEGTGIPKKTERYEWEFEAVAEVLTVGEDGAVERLLCKVEKCIDKAAAGRELLPKGYDLFILFRNGVATPPFDKPLPPEDAQLAVMNLLTVGEPGVDLDALFSSGTPRALGAKWPADVKAFLGKSGSDDQATPPEEVGLGGEAHLRGKTKVGEVDCLDLHCEVTFEGLPQPSEWTLAGDTVITVEADMILPLDPALPALSIESKSSMTMDSKMPNPQGGSAVFKAKTEKSVKTKFEPVRR